MKTGYNTKEKTKHYKEVLSNENVVENVKPDEVWNSEFLRNEVVIWYLSMIQDTVVRVLNIIEKVSSNPDQVFCIYIVC